MELANWEAEIEKNDWLVASYVILLEDEDDISSSIKIRLKLIDFSVLDFYEAIDNEFLTHKYGYQWMNKNMELIRRWDNNAHHSYIPTYPFHQHIGSEENVHSSEEMTLEKVLDFISKNLA